MYGTSNRAAVKIRNRRLLRNFFQKHSLLCPLKLRAKAAEPHSCSGPIPHIFTFPVGLLP